MIKSEQYFMITCAYPLPRCVAEIASVYEVVTCIIAALARRDTSVYASFLSHL